MDWPPGTMRPLYLYKGNYPSTITTLRGPTWHPNNLEGTPEQLEAWGTESTTTGYIPQVSNLGNCFSIPIRKREYLSCPMINHMRLLRDFVSRKDFFSLD